MNHDEHLDHLLDEALSEYRDAEPLAGIESRILARLELSGPSRRPFVLRWALALACAAAIAAAVWFGVGRRPQHNVLPAETAATKPVEHAPIPAPAVVASASAAVKIRKPADRTAQHETYTPAAAPTSPAEFPSPTPLSPGERALLAALNQSSHTMPAASQPDQAITIAEIEIKPLSIGGVASSENPGEKP